MKLGMNILPVDNIAVTTFNPLVPELNANGDVHNTGI
jgi:hypothetical protein